MEFSQPPRMGRQRLYRSAVRVAGFRVQNLAGGRILSATNSSCASCVLAGQLFDAQELVVFRQPIRTAERAGFDLAAVRRHGDVSNGRVLGFAARSYLSLLTGPSG